MALPNQNFVSYILYKKYTMHCCAQDCLGLNFIALFVAAEIFSMEVLQEVVKNESLANDEAFLFFNTGEQNLHKYFYFIISILAFD